ncbi:unnamed protein product [Cylicocyclus nassatus]|uniref:CCHC-type domain-containing protein n=1 Tax=Cylicocyclus nassatus TaxID=53992 RepID=A0AA36GIS5_CYLNA|nr:unnamed protein product [Cylicocyclus nassatus]
MGETIASAVYFRSDLIEQRSHLYNAYVKIQKLDEQWSNARSSDTAEEEIYNDYVKKYGDYSTAVQDAVDLLEEIDDILNSYDKELIRRQLPLPAENDERVPHTAQIQTRAAYYQNATESTMNFVDASILSRLDLPVFDGNLLDYPEFMARFSTLIGNKKDLDDATKFSLLKSCLKGRALQSIHGLALTAHNYSIALDILKSRYDDKVTTCHILFTQLASLPACDEQGKHLQSLYNKMYSLTRQFCSFEDDTKEIALGAILLNKLPRFVRSMIYDRAGKTRNLTPSELLQISTDIVHKEATLQEIEYYNRRTDRCEDIYFASHAQRKRSTPYTQKRFPSSKTTSNENIKPPSLRIKACSFCDSKEHNAIRCTTWPTAQQRIQVIKERKLCFNCLSPKHRTKECPSTRTCQQCAKRHHTSICLQNRPPSQQTYQQRRPPEDRESNRRSREMSQMHFAEGSPNVNQSNPQVITEQNDIVAVVQHTPLNKQPILLMCANVDVSNPETPNERIAAMAFFDSGSSRSYITKELAKELHLSQGQMEEVSIYTFASGSPLSLLTTLHSIGIYTSKGGQILCVKAIETLTKELKIVQQNFEDSATLVSTKKKPSLLIGADYFWDVLFFDDFYIQSISSGYHLVHSAVGDIITGKTLWQSKNMEHCFNIDESQEENLDKLVTQLWLHDDVHDSYSEDDSKCLRNFNETIYFDEIEGRYVVQLPFKGDKRDLPNNIQLAYARLLHNMKHLQHCPETLNRYHALIQEQLRKGIIEAVHEPKLPKLCHYLPHHAVISEEKRSTKLRCVYDGSAKSKGKPSLNELLYRGPVFLPDITGILLRIRLPKILISSDIEKAFLMVGLNEESRNFTRFLWVKDPKGPITPENIVTYRFRRVPFGLIASPFLLAGTIQYHLRMADTPCHKKF